MHVQDFGIEFLIFSSAIMKAKNNSKAAEKKKERLAMQKKMDSRILIVKAANAQANPLDALPSFKVFRIDILFDYERDLKRFFCCN